MASMVNYTWCFKGEKTPDQSFTNFEKMEEKEIPPSSSYEVST